MVDERMVRVSRKRPCPVCGKPTWCLVAPDGSAAICPRIQEGSVKKCGDAGWLHILEKRHNRHNGHKGSVRRRHLLKCISTPDGRQNDFAERSKRYQQELTGKGLEALVRVLGVSAGSLRRLGIGWDGGAYTFPMSDDSGTIVGIRRRFPAGSKASVRGSKTGLFVPVDLGDDGPLLICEGGSDTAAALDLGFPAVGRPNCNSLAEMTARMVRGRTEIAVIADSDNAGISGAMKLANVIARHCPNVKVVRPPRGIKDLRQWLKQGLTHEALCGILGGIQSIKVRVAFSRREVRR